ncbi:Flp family type IVb pilin [Peredibacter sp. HCB2-198]|uniref:Flp family type IVb pilin n=1 Tax=Peredibacter sp. HCB2-198 TaxID=3383025 RepID=UPI0038B586A1
MIRFIRNKKGQTAIEYLLVLTVAISIGIAFTKKMKDYLIESPNSVIGKQLNILKSQFEQNPDCKYCYYKLL